MVPVLETVFLSAAAPQKGVFVLLATAALLAPVLALRSGRTGPWRTLLSDMRLIAPLLGMLTAGADSFHMARTILKLPGDVTARQLAPGILEVSALMVTGALVGLIAQGLLMASNAVPPRAE